MSSLFGSLPAEQRSWVLFHDMEGESSESLKGGRGGGWTVPGMTEESLAVVVDSVCDGTCSSFLAHQFHGPELWFLDVRYGSLFGRGFQFQGNSPLRKTQEMDGIFQMRYVVVAENGVTHCIYSKKLENEIVLAYMQENHLGHVSATYETVNSDGNVFGSRQECQLTRHCPVCASRHELCECSMAAREKKLIEMSVSKLADNQNVLEASLKEVYRLNTGKSATTIFSHYFRDESVVKIFRNLVCAQNSNSTIDETIIVDPMTNRSPGETTSSQQKEKVCKLCGTEFLKSYHLRRHYENVHCGLKRHECKFCHRTFSQSGHLNEHTRTFHLMTSSFKCLECGKCFGAQSKLARHVSAVHQNLRLYACRLCGKSFKEKNHLNKHYLSHQSKQSTTEQAVNPGSSTATPTQ